MEKTIQATEANRQFSRILREVAEGDTFTVTSHGRPIARIVPALPKGSDPRSSACSNVCAAARHGNRSVDARGTLRLLACWTPASWYMPRASRKSGDGSGDRHRQCGSTFLEFSCRHRCWESCSTFLCGKLAGALAADHRAGLARRLRRDRYHGRNTCAGDGRSGRSWPDDLGCSNPRRCVRSRLPHSAVGGHARRLHMGRGDHREPIRGVTTPAALRTA